MKPAPCQLPPPHDPSRATWLLGYVARYIEFEVLTPRVARVMAEMPDEVLRDLLEDPHFHLALEDFQPGRGTKVFLAVGAGQWNGSRSVVLRPRLATCREEFAHYVIAHEFAHAHLRNGAWGEHRDPEHAADALAASWGFARPPGGWY